VEKASLCSQHSASGYEPRASAKAQLEWFDRENALGPLRRAYEFFEGCSTASVTSKPRQSIIKYGRLRNISFDVLDTARLHLAALILPGVQNGQMFAWETLQLE
jgi:hypothetical protein